MEMLLGYAAAPILRTGGCERLDTSRGLFQHLRQALHMDRISAAVAPYYGVNTSRMAQAAGAVRLSKPSTMIPNNPMAFGAECVFYLDTCVLYPQRISAVPPSALFSLYIGSANWEVLH